MSTCCLLDLSSDLGPFSAVLEVDPLQAGSSPDDVDMCINQALQAHSDHDWLKTQWSWGMLQPLGNSCWREAQHCCALQIHSYRHHKASLHVPFAADTFCLGLYHLIRPNGLNRAIRPSKERLSLRILQA